MPAASNGFFDSTYRNRNGSVIVNYSYSSRLVRIATGIWLSSLPVLHGQITPFTTQPAAQTQNQDQNPTPGATPQGGQVGPSVGGILPERPGGQTSVEAIRPNYELGPTDQIMIHAPDAEEMNDKTFRIEDDGTVTLPLIGAVKVGGSTVAQVEEDLKNRLKTYVRNPTISITVVQFRSSPVFFVGQFQRPGIYALQGRHTLVEMLQAVGGLQPTAGRRIKIIRKMESGPIPLSSAVEDPLSKTSTVEINLRSLTQNVNPAEDIELEPYDIVEVDRAEQVYLMGPGVGKAGGIDVGDRDYITVLQVLASTGGLTPNAIPEKAVILRPVLGTARRAKIPINLAKIMSTEGNDYPLLPNDILQVPAKKEKGQFETRLATVLVTGLASTLLFVLINKI
ncbi:MAG TPA: polysaccharide biosynthesis/export family protein [Bryobacteraceae bacterium]|jgi:polysaccharide export outer membrane protein|nr:polysaccharide biosynthesis/export family protein [Bryobacteraceae bacterium]